jgi:CheY-like chemotaxis protein
MAGDTPLILVVEEETHERAAIVEHLAGQGFRTLEAETTDTALEHLRGGEPVAGLVTDAHVPGGIDGHELARHARETSPHLAVVLISGHSDESSGPVPEGAEFVAKPYLLEHLGPTLQRLLANGGPRG